jgi:3'-phosphoadenosine 5'-phosphosulfate sulfotransferase (PAPS reductase)/FAD synthetase
MTDRPRIAVASVSGGKDSHATALLAIDEYGPENVRLVHAWTGHEHEITDAFIRNDLPAMFGRSIDIVQADFTSDMTRKRAYIETHWMQDLTTGKPGEWKWKGDGPMPMLQPIDPADPYRYCSFGDWHWTPERAPLKDYDAQAVIGLALEMLVPTGNPFLDLCLMKGRFPSRKAQFCTQELKRYPLDKYMLDLIGQGYEVESWQGIRRDESMRRKDALERERGAEGWLIRRPIVDWTAQQVVDFVTLRGHRLNPLYSMGCDRVGCMLCINAGKDEIANAARRWPHHIHRIREWERMVAIASKRGLASLFAGTGDVEGLMPDEYARASSIDATVDWAMTTRGAKQYDLFKTGLPVACASSYGLCE